MTTHTPEQYEPVPVIIYLQWYGDEDPDCLTVTEKSRKPSLDEVSWCWEQIFPYDVIYIRNDKYAELEAQNAALSAQVAELMEAIDSTVSKFDSLSL